MLIFSPAAARPAFSSARVCPARVMSISVER